MILKRGNRFLDRDHLGIKPGSKVEFRRAADGGIVFERAG